MTNKCVKWVDSKRNNSVKISNSPLPQCLIMYIAYTCALVNLSWFMYRHFFLQILSFDFTIINQNIV